MATYEVSDSGFLLAVDQKRTGFVGEAKSGFGMVFSVDVPVEWAISGSYSVIDAVDTAQPGEVKWRIRLQPAGVPIGSDLFAQDDTSLDTVDETFVVGERGGGDSESGTFGSTTGILDPDVVYSFSVSQIMRALNSRITTPATAAGSVSLVFTDADRDNDGVLNASDNCASDFNPDQSDFDGNGIGDACDEPPLPLQTPNPMNLSSLRVVVELDDGLTSVVAFDETLPLESLGSGRMSVEPFGVLAPGAQLNRFEFDYGGPHGFNTELGAAKLPVSLAIDEATFSVGGGVENPLGQVEIGGALPLDPSTIDASVAGSVNVDGRSAPFSLYGIGFPCSPCLASEPNVQPSAVVDGLEDVEISGLSGVNDRANPLALPPAQQTTQAIPGFSVSVQVESVVQGARFAVPEPSSHALAMAALLLTAGLAAAVRRRP